MCPNSNYLKGVRKERKIVNEARAQGKIAFRSAGSHSPIDVCTIDPERKVIRFIQCKPEEFSETAKGRLLEKYLNLNAQFQVYFEVI